jgi:hypothetical protein
MEIPTNRFSEPSGMNTPSECKYSMNDDGRDCTIFERGVIEENFGYQDENWNVRSDSVVTVGKRVG